MEIVIEELGIDTGDNLYFEKQPFIGNDSKSVIRLTGDAGDVFYVGEFPAMAVAVGPDGQPVGMRMETLPFLIEANSIEDAFENFDVACESFQEAKQAEQSPIIRPGVPSLPGGALGMLG